MTPHRFILAILALWLALLGFTVAHALLTGRIRMGMAGDPPTERARDPGAFWTTFALSVGGLVVGFFVLCGFLKLVMPAPWAQAMGALGL